MSDYDDSLTDLLIKMLRSESTTLVMGAAYPKRPDFIVGGESGLPGSKLHLCDECGATLHLFDSHIILDRHPDVPVICILCAAKK